MNLSKDFRYPIAVIAFYLTLRISYSFFNVELDAEVSLGWLELGISNLRSMADAILLALPMWCLGKRFKVLSHIWFLLVDVILLSSIWYSRNFGTVIHYTDFFMVDNLDGLAPSIIASMRWSDVCVLLPFLFFISLDYWGINRKYVLGKRSILLYCVSLFFAIVVEVHAGMNNYVGCGFNRILVTTYYGVFHVMRYDYISHRECTLEEIEQIPLFLAEIDKEPDTLYTVFPSQKNLIVILVESLASWPINLIVGGREVTPCLNKIVSEDLVSYFPYVVPQTKDGRSSDAQLILNTGLLPMQSGATACFYSNNKYPSLPKALRQKGYDSYNFICDAPSFWFQGATTKAYGFTHLFDKLELSGNKKNLTDRELFSYTLSHLKELSEPFYAQIVTLSMHHPYNASNCPDKDSPFLQSDNLDEEVAYYLAATHYTDKCIGEFIEALKKTSLFENSILLITGDHEHITFDQFEGRTATEVADTYIPLIILNAPLTVENTAAVIGQSDIYPSLLYMMGAGDYFFKGVGQNFFLQQDDCAVSRSGKVAGGNLREDRVARKRKAWQVSDWIIRSDYFRR